MRFLLFATTFSILFFFRMTWNLIQYSTLMRTISTVNFVQIGQRLVPQKWLKVPPKSYVPVLLSHSTPWNLTRKVGLFWAVQLNTQEHLWSVSWKSEPIFYVKNWPKIKNFGNISELSVFRDFSWPHMLIFYFLTFIGQYQY